MKNTEKAFRWIIGILEKHKIRFQITGGLAARAYGSRRPLADIDIDIPENQFEKIATDVERYVIWGPEKFINDNWDLTLMTLKFFGQEIDICGASVKMRDHQSGKWIRNTTDFSKAVTRELYGIRVPVIRKRDLVKYKKILGRNVDVDDLSALKAAE